MTTGNPTTTVQIKIRCRGEYCAECGRRKKTTTDRWVCTLFGRGLAKSESGKMGYVRLLRCKDCINAEEKI